MPDQLSDTRTTGDDVGRDPDVIQREIEETRAELARTVDLIADRLSPRRAASRGASKVRSGIEGVFTRDEGDNDVEVHVPDGAPGEAQVERGIRTVPLPPTAEVTRELRTDRVAMVAAGVVALTALVVWRKKRRT